MALTDGMKEKLLNRDEIDLSNRKANEYHIRKYIQKYFKDMEEIIWLLDAMPQKQVEKLIEDGKAADTTMRLCEKILGKMELPTVRAVYPGTAIEAVKSYDLGADNMRILTEEGEEMALQPVGCSIVCGLTKSESIAIERTLTHIGIIKDSLMPTREKTSQRKLYEEIYPAASKEAEKKGVKCSLQWDVAENMESIDFLLRVLVHHQGRRQVAEMLAERNGGAADLHHQKAEF